jgi:nitrogenase molybdenum-iron protein beta chain
MSSTIIEQPRHFCALSAQQSVVAIPRAIPIVHAGPGCSGKLYGGLSFRNGFQGSSYAGGTAISCTNMCEQEVVFGGEERLREVIEGALKVIDGDLYVVLTGCTADLVGDDAGQVAREFRERGNPVVHVSTAGFKGTGYHGHELVVRAIIDQFLQPVKSTIPNLVNVWSVVPYHDTFWNGNLQAIRDLLGTIGLRANILFGHDSGGVAAWKQVPAAQFNLVLSPWVGVNIAEHLEERFGTPFLHYPVLPIGAVETSRFLRRIASFAGIDDSVVHRVVAERESYFYHYLERSADFFLECRLDLPSHFINIADSFYAVGVTRFLVNELGLLPGPQFITDQPPAEHRPAIEEQFAGLTSRISAEVAFSPDGGEIAQRILDRPYEEPPLILGSSWDLALAKQLRGHHLSIGLPVTDRLVLDRAYVGYQGGLRLIEDIYAAVLGARQ